MTEAKPAIFGTAYAGWRDGLAASRDMPTVAVCAFLAILFDNTTSDAVAMAIRGGNFAWGWSFSRLGLAFVFSFLLVPAAVAIHRYILLGEATNKYDLNPSSRRFRLYFAYATVLELLIAVFMMMTDSGDVDSANVTPGQLALMISIVVAFLALSVCMTVLLPAIAVDASGANFWNAVKDTHFWRAFLIRAVAIVPPTTAFALLLLLDTTSDELTPQWMLSVIYTSALQTSIFIALTAVASHLYRAWANRLGRPAGIVE